MKSRASLEPRTLRGLAIDDVRSFRHVALYADLEDVLRRARYRFRVMPRSRHPRTDRALLLNLTFWSADAGGDVLVDRHIPADVVAHAAWHHLAAQAFGPKPSAASLFLGESIASAFDVYLMGRLLGHAPGSSFLKTQVPAMADATAAAGMSARAFQRLLRTLAADPEGAFSDLRELLFDATSALHACRGAEQAYRALAPLEGHRFGALLPRYELSNWVLYARAYTGRRASDARVRKVDAALRKGRALDWLQRHWVMPALADGTRRRPDH